MIPRRHWLVAAPAALLLHLAGFAAWQGSDDGEALAPGEQGVEIALGLIGDLGEAETEVDPTPPPPPPKETQEPPPPIENLPPPTPIQERPTLPTAPVRPPPPRQTPAPERSPSSEPPSAAAAVVRPQQVRRGEGQALDNRRGGHVGAKRSYAALLAAHLNRHKRYPLASRRRREEGVVELRLVVRRDGGVVQVAVARSGPPALNTAAMRMLDDAKPLPAFPSDLPLPRVTVVVPVSFRLASLHSIGVRR